MRTLRWLSLGTLLLLTLAGCSGAETVTAEQIMDGLRQARETTRDAHAVAEVVTTGTREDGRFLVETWLRKTDETDALGKPIAQTRAKVLEASKSELVGTEIINDGGTITLWNPTGNKVIQGSLQDLKQGEIGAQDPTAQMLRMEEQLQQLLDGSDVTILAENEPVAGLAAWKVKLTPKPETAAQMQIGSAIDTTLWIQHERYIPLRAVISAGDMGTLEATVQRIELDQGVDAAVFTFTPPAGAEIIDAAELAQQARPTTTTLEGARAAASFPVLVPEPLPEGVVLDEVQSLSMGGETVIQNYSGPIEFSLVQTRGAGALAEGDTPLGTASQAVTVRGQAGTLVTGSGAEQGTLLRWEENGVTVVLAGTLSAEQAQSIAASLR